MMRCTHECLPVAFGPTLGEGDRDRNLYIYIFKRIYIYAFLVRLITGDFRVLIASKGG